MKLSTIILLTAFFVALFFNSVAGRKCHKFKFFKILLLQSNFKKFSIQFYRRWNNFSTTSLCYCRNCNHYWNCIRTNDYCGKYIMHLSLEIDLIDLLIYITYLFYFWRLARASNVFVLRSLVQLHSQHVLRLLQYSFKGNLAPLNHHQK